MKTKLSDRILSNVFLIYIANDKNHNGKCTHLSGSYIKLILLLKVLDGNM